MLGVVSVLTLLGTAGCADIQPTATLQPAYKTIPALTWTPEPATPTNTATLAPIATETPFPTLTTTQTEFIPPPPLDAEIEKCKHLALGDVGCLYAEEENGTIMDLILRDVGNIVTTQKGTASVWDGTNVELVLADFERDGYFFNLIKDKTRVYFIHPDGTWETYQLIPASPRVNFYDINGEKTTWSRSPNLTPPFISADEIMRIYWNENKPRGNKDKSILRLETCIMGLRPKAYTIPISDPIVEIGVTITTLRQTYPASPTPTP